MSSFYFKNEEKLNDASNFGPWKARLIITLKEHDVLEYVQGKVAQPLETINVAARARFNKGEVKAKKFILGSFGEHLITYVSKLNKSKEMYDKQVGMYQVNNLSQILASKNQLKDIKMNKGETIQAYFMRIPKIKDQLLVKLYLIKCLC